MAKRMDDEGWLDEDGFDRTREGFFVDGLGLGADFVEQKAARINKNDSHWGAVSKIGNLRDDAQEGDPSAQKAQSPGWLRLGEKTRSRIPGAAALNEINGNACQRTDPLERRNAQRSLFFARRAEKKARKLTRKHQGWGHTITKTVLLLAMMCAGSFYIAGARSVEDVRHLVVKRAVSMALRLPDGIGKTVSKQTALLLGTPRELPVFFTQENP